MREISFHHWNVEYRNLYRALNSISFHKKITHLYWRQSIKPSNIHVWYPSYLNYSIPPKGKMIHREDFVKCFDTANSFLLFCVQISPKEYSVSNANKHHAHKKSTYTKCLWWRWTWKTIPFCINISPRLFYYVIVIKFLYKRARNDTRHRAEITLNFLFLT